MTRASPAIDFPRSFLYCVPHDAGIWVRIQLECLGRLVDHATGKSDEYALGVLAIRRRRLAEPER